MGTLKNFSIKLLIVAVLIAFFFIVKTVDEEMTDKRIEKCKGKNPGDIVMVYSKTRTCT